MFILFLLVGCRSDLQPISEFTQKENYQLIVQIKDLTPPKIHLSSDQIELEQGESFDLDEVITITDNRDRNLPYKISGEVDTETAGTYTLKITCQDLAGNHAEAELTVIVEEKEADLPREPDDQKPRPVQPNVPQPSVPVQPEENKPADIPTINTPSISSQKFLFVDGYTYESAYSACVASGSTALESNQAARYTCTPIKEDGKYIGYQLSLE